MKNLTYNKIWIVLIGFILTLSCSDEDFLKEERRDGLNTENAFRNKAQFETLLGNVYRQVREFYNSGDGDSDAWIKGLGTDVFFWPRGDDRVYNDWAKLNPFEGYSSRWFNWQYIIIRDANTAIDAAQKEDVIWNSDAERDAIIAEGRFLRAFAYRNLANLYGGVPIIDGPVTEPKVDFVRATREETWQFIKADLDFARTYLPLEAEFPGKVVRAAADHLLAEVNISLKNYDEAIAAATRVIDGTDGDYQLMDGRFGARADEPNKNVYWDLFRMGNQNREESGNKEGIWVAQMEYNVPGGTIRFGRPTTERMFQNFHWGFQKAGYTGPAQDSTGRGVAFVRGGNHANYTIWRGAGNDLRNTEAAIKRKFYFADDVAPYSKGDLIPKSFLTVAEDSMLHIFPNWQKFGTDKHLDGRPDNGYVRDFYVMRLSETYLLRAEAYLGKGQSDMAADDINAIRTRAQAPLVDAGDVDIDYILDERIRELYGEEYRMLTLGRLGLIYDRTKRFGHEPARNSIQEFNNLFPIPQSAIDRNGGAVLGQNPGY
ncbi:RagB/SusD family nutrient uptake outer membrane protein [Snuella sedimenti]|uniref:RagB/SusD family nutrient uptake outer membrane protein n=1 Tax=Snuella sedimenti TaxID=2798802 RepID=A0A8J7LYM3_9FLAO|nr:RagB/SusD family nutrient uptake outer membrane protein [Snuella sedimenti]MBJ6368636.1 RagB/SusD family nutrient uptake outer membrane protein [Snuella sedimenti]